MTHKYSRPLERGFAPTREDRYRVLAVNSPLRLRRKPRISPTLVYYFSLCKKSITTHDGRRSFRRDTERPNEMWTERKREAAENDAPRKG